MSKPKYEKGKPITSIDELINCDLVYLEEKVQCRAWIGCWRLKDAAKLIENKHLHHVVERRKSNV